MRYVTLVVLTLCLANSGAFAQGAAAGKSVSRRLVDNAKNSSYQNAAKRFFAAPATASKAAAAVQKGGAASSDKLRQSLEARIAELRAQNQTLQAQINQLNHVQRLDGATFRASENDEPFASVFSGTVFKTKYNGQDEIFGVVAAHTIAPDISHSAEALHKNFVVVMHINGVRKRFPVEIVQVSAPSMLDMALIKFRPEDEALLTPLTVQRNVRKGEPLYSHGFASGEEMEVPREVVEETYLSFRTTIPVPRSKRPGFCGSPVLNARHELVGIHTGSIYEKAGESCDIGFAISAKFLDVLVKAYHNDGQALFPLVVDGHVLANMNVDEYVSVVTIYDDNMRQLWQQGFDYKFSQSKVEQAIRSIPQARYVLTTTRRAYWEEDGKILTENRSRSDKTKKRYKYDLWEKQIVSVK